LPLLEERKDELSKCAYCPKLCRASCVVSEQLPREALTPWGKMTSAFGAAETGQVDAESAELAWGCSNCFRCREACDHRNPVTETLNDARAAYVSLGQAPPAIGALLAREATVFAEQTGALKRLAHERGVHARADKALLLGCRYARALPNDARAGIRLATELAGPVRLLSGCCGAWQRAAGDPARARARREALQTELGGAELLVLDPRCALELAELEPLSLVELAARHPERFGVRPGQAWPVRYHDSCALGRGLGLYDEPRLLLERVTGSAPLELETPREHSRCSGAGGMLPVSMPDVAHAAAEQLAQQHRRLGGGVLVTGCASSTSWLKHTGAEVVDLVTLLAKGLVSDE
jgi:Fe-S oxidoreductase